VITLALDGLEELLRRVVREELAAANTSTWLNAEEAAAYLGTSRAQVHNLVAAGRLPRHGEKGHSLRFTRADLDLYLESRGRR
jgi:excisionase family DNA binding protein